MNILLFLIIVLYVGSITANIMNIYLNYKRGVDFAKIIAKQEIEIQERKKMLEDEIDRFNTHVMNLNMSDFVVDEKGVKH